MKKLSKILAALLSLTMLFGMITIPNAAAFSDVDTENNFYDSITILSAFGIINGYEDGTFGPDKDVTRAEFATMLMRAMASAGLGSTDAAGTPFTDIEGHWGISDIRTAYDLGIINGMTLTTFEPNSNVTYEQALKMIVCALNYGGQAESVQNTVPNQPWYYGYLQTARNLNLTDNVPVVTGQPAKRAHIAQMIYNALDVNMLEKIDHEAGPIYMASNQTWLKDKLKITKARGELVADETNTVSETGTVARVGYATFTNESNNSNVSVAKNGISLDGLLGKYVEYYYKTDIDGSKKLVLAYSKAGSNVSLKIDASNLNKVSGSYEAGYTVQYYESATATNVREARVDAKAVVSFNGEVRTDITPADLNIEAGTIELISNGGNYTKMVVESYETYVVKSVNRTDKYIVDMFRPVGSDKDNQLTIDDEDGDYVITMKNSSGSITGLTNLVQYNVLTVKKGKGTAGRTTLDITVSNKNVTGIIKEIDDEYVNINGTEYEISTYLYKYGESAISALRTGDNCKAYLDVNGRVAYIMKTASTTTYFGYIADVSVSSSDVVRIALVSKKTPTMGSPYINVAKKVKIDGEVCSSTDKVKEILEEAASEPNTNIDGYGSRYSQLVKYTLNSAGEISEIDTVIINEEREDPDDETTFKAFERNENNNKMKYKSSSRDFQGDTSSDKFRISSSTEVFIVPTESEENSEGRTDFEAYGRKSSSYFKDGQEYIVEAYNVTGGLNIAEVVVVYETEDTQAVVEYNTPLFVITKIQQETNADGDESDKVTGYQITSSGTVSEKTYFTSDANVIAGEYSVGDVIIFVTNNKGYINEETIIHALDADDFEAGKKTISEGSTTHQTVLYRGLLVGAQVDGTTQLFDIALEDEPEDCEGSDKVYSRSAPSSTKFFVYDPEAKGSDKITQQESFDLTSLSSFNETVVKDEETEEVVSAEAAKLFVYEYYGSVRAIIVVK